jgi:hypothetical protein
VIACAESWDDIALYGRNKVGWLQSFVSLANGIPSHATFRRVFPGGNIRPTLPESGLRVKNLIRLRAAGSRSPIRARHKAGPPVRCMAICMPGQGTRYRHDVVGPAPASALPVVPAYTSAAVSDRSCRQYGATLVVTKLDRLARNVAFISKLMESGIDFVAADFPQANRLTVHILAAVAEHAATMISQRTRAALAAAKVCGDDACHR